MAHVVPGVEELAWEEIAERLPGARKVAVWPRVDRRAGVLLFRAAASASSMLELRLLEDLFAVVAIERRLSTQRAGLAQIGRIASEAVHLEEALGLFREATSGSPKRPRSFRVVARRTGRHTFRRLDAQRACEDGLKKRLRRWRLQEEGAAFEFWLQVIGQVAIIALRLSFEAMRQRTYRSVSLPAALKPTVAQALVRLARPPEGGLLIDPMCGGGTVLAEAAGLGLRTLGGDNAADALEAARLNLRSVGVSAVLVRWDAQRLPIARGAAAGVACNLPWGRRHAVADLSQLYRGVLRESHRIVRGSGRIALLTSEHRLLERLVRRQRGLEVERRLQLVVRGMDAWLFVLRRVS